MGNSATSMKVMLSMNILNIVGNATLVFGFHMGVEGIAIPTLVSRIGAAIIILILARNEKNDIQIKGFIKEKFDWRMIRRITRIGLPNGLENGLFQLGRLMVITMVSYFGTAAIAANAVAGSIYNVLILPGMGINIGLSIIVSRCVGSGSYQQAMYYKRRVFKIIHIGFIISAAIVLAAMKPLMYIYNLSDEATSMIWYIIIISCILVNVIWIPSWSLPVVFRASGDSTFPMIIAVCSMIGARLVSAYILSCICGLGMVGTWYAMFIDWIVREIFFIYRYHKGTWKRYDALR